MKLCFSANLEEQNKIAKLLLEVDNLCDGYQKKIHILKNVKRTLLNKMFE